MRAEEWLFLGGARTSTWAIAVLLLAAGVVLRDRRWRAGVACLAWIFGFEVAWQFTSTAVHGGTLAADVTSLYQVLVAGGWVVAAQLAGVRVDWRMALLTAVLWLIWLLAGFHSNLHTAATLDPIAEVLNEASKTAWGLAYLLPLWKDRSRGACPAGGGL